MKKIITTLCLMFTLAIVLTGCGGQQNGQSNSSATENNSNFCYKDCEDVKILMGRTEEQCKKTCDLMKKMADAGCEKSSEAMGEGESLAAACERYVEKYQW